MEQGSSRIYWCVVALLLILVACTCCQKKKGFGLANIRASQQRWMGMIPIGPPLYGEKECIEMVPGILLHCFCEAGRYSTMYHRHVLYSKSRVDMSLQMSTLHRRLSIAFFLSFFSLSFVFSPPRKALPRLLCFFGICTSKKR